MEKFFIPGDTSKFVNWLLHKANEMVWTIVVEYSSNDAYAFLKKIATEVPLPITSRHEYNSDCKLSAFVNPIVDNFTVDQIMIMTHVLSIHSSKEMLFLIADDFHEECFSSSVDFYNNYRQIICDMNLADVYHRD